MVQAENCNPADPTHDWTYTYDALGRLKTVTTVRRNGVDLITAEVTTYSYDLQGRMSEVVIDTYDSNDNIVKKETTTYVYDGRGIRVGSTYKVEVDDDQTRRPT